MTVLDPMHRLRTALESPMRPAPHRLTLVSAKDGSCMHACSSSRSAYMLLPVFFKLLHNHTRRRNSPQASPLFSAQVWRIYCTHACNF